jgi:protein ATS1
MLYAWGWNEHGNLGIGSLEDQWGAVEVPLPRDGGGKTQRVQGMWAGCGTSWVLVDG